jgi:diaminohydroxyphosphoribosylaminopyrimidine deaminase/5-amino-6-(5-phosphoribosylamino)uracil reductase
LPRQAALLTDRYRERTLIWRGQSPRQVLEGLTARGCNRVLVEGGASVLSAFFAAGLVNEIAFFYAPLLLGTSQRLHSWPRQASQLESVVYEPCGKDLLVRGIVKNAGSCPEIP